MPRSLLIFALLGGGSIQMSLFLPLIRALPVLILAVCCAWSDLASAEMFKCQREDATSVLRNYPCGNDENIRSIDGVSPEELKQKVAEHQRTENAKVATETAADEAYTAAQAFDRSTRTPRPTDGNPPTMNKVGVLQQQGYSVRMITLIFGQLVTFSLPKGFVPAFEEAKGGQYIQESVLEGESVKKWSQMITVTGAKGLASNPNVTPARFSGGMESGFKRTCPDSFSATGLGETQFGNYDAFASVISCGIAIPTGTPYSESMLLIVIKGENDYYTIQWAERGGASKTPIKFDNVKWMDRMKKLAPIRLCPIIPGEKAPYVSCVNRA